MSSEIPTKIKGFLFIATHPILSLRTKERQLAVALEQKAPPHTSSWEEFPKLPLADAARKIIAEEKN